MTFSRPILHGSLCLLLMACGGGGGSGSPATAPAAAPAAAAAPTFRDLTIPVGFSPATASIKSVSVNADQLAAGGGLPAGHGDARVYTWVTLAYSEPGGTARTVGVLRWTALAALGATGLRLELPSQVTRLNFEIYNANGTKSGSLPV